MIQTASVWGRQRIHQKVTFNFACITLFYFLYSLFHQQLPTLTIWPFCNKDAPYTKLTLLTKKATPCELRKKAQVKRKIKNVRLLSKVSKMDESNNQFYVLDICDTLFTGSQTNLVFIAFKIKPKVNNTGRLDAK